MGYYKAIEILLKTNRGIIFEKTETKNRCKVTVRNKDGGYAHMIYRFNKDAEPVASRYISWQNLNCCGGWAFDESYLLTAVQREKKLCSGIVFNEEKEYINCKESISGEYQYFTRPPMTNGFRTFYYVDVFRNGAIRDYINESNVLRAYDKLGIRNFNRELLSELLGLPMRRLVSGETFDYANPRAPEEWITTGLLLGYPLESTAWLLEKLHKGK